MNDLSSEEQVSRVIQATKYFPKIRRGHGSRRKDTFSRPVCVADGCVKSKDGVLNFSPDHSQNRLEAAMEHFEESGVKFKPVAKIVLKALLA